MKKILIISNTFSKDEGGATAIAFEQAKSLKERGFDVHVFAGDFEKGYTENDQFGIKIFKIKIKNTDRYILRSWLAMRNLRVEREFKDFLKQNKFDVIHFHNLYYQAPFSLIKIARRNCEKVFFTAHDVMTFSNQKLSFFVDQKWSLENIDEVNYRLTWWQQLKQDKKAFNPFRNIYIRNCLKKCTKIIAVSNELKKALEQNKIKNVAVVHNGIDRQEWQEKTQEIERLKNELDLDNKKVMLFAGRLSGQKGGDVVLKMLQKVAQKIPEIRLLVLGGDKNYFKKLEEKVETMRIRQNIIMLGKVARGEMKKYYHLTDLVLVPSVYLDPFPTINLESIASNTPVVATIFGGSREIIKDQKNGFLVNPLDVDRFSTGVLGFFENQNLKVEVGDLQEFTKEKWIDNILFFYNFL